MDKTTLLSYMPFYYLNSKVMNELQNANALELTNLQNKIQNAVNQFFIDTADTSLSRWEKEYGLKVDNNLDIELRRSRIKARKRGQGTTTKELIKNVVSAFGDDADIVENNENYEFTVNVIRTTKEGLNLNDLEAAVEDIKPAHLALNVEITNKSNLQLNTSYTKYEKTYRVCSTTLCCGAEVYI